MVHGGIDDSIDLEKIRKIKRDSPTLDDQYIIDSLTWSDPNDEIGIFYSTRGSGFFFRSRCDERIFRKKQNFINYSQSSIQRGRFLRTARRPLHYHIFLP